MKVACPKCGANIKFMPKLGKCFCEYCNNYIEIDDMSNDVTEYTRLKCSTCGADLITNEISVMTNCVYCGSGQLLTERLEKNPKGFNPEEILPFEVEKEESKQCFKRLIDKEKKIFKNESIVISSFENIKGIYIPFTVYEWKLETYINDEKKEILYEDTDIMLEDVSWKFKENIIKLIQDYDLEKLEKYKSAYLAGFNAEIADETIFIQKGEIPKRFTEKTKYKQAIKNICKRFGKETKDNVVNDIKLLKKKSILLPIWFLDVEGKCEFISNGRTGTATCVIKKDNNKMIYNPLTHKFIYENKKKRKNKIIITHKEMSLGKILFIIFGIAFIILVGLFLIGVYL